MSGGQAHSNDEPISPEPGNKKRISGGSTTSASVETLAWNKLYSISVTEWNKLFLLMRGEHLKAFESSDLHHPRYAPTSDIRAKRLVAFTITLRVLQVMRSLCNCKVKAPPACSEAEVTTRLWLLISSIQACNILHKEGVIQHDQLAPEHSDELQPETSTAENLEKEAPHSAESPETKKAKHPNQTSEDDLKSHISGSSGSLPGPGNIGEERKFKLDGRTIFADMTIMCEETILAAAHQQINQSNKGRLSAPGITGLDPLWIVIATVEVKLGPLTLLDVRQSYCQGVAALLKDRIKGSRHGTRSILINQTSMIVMEYSLDDEFIKEVIERKRTAVDIPTNEIRGEFKVIYTGPFGLDLHNAMVREVFVGLVAPSFRSHIGQAQLVANLTAMLQQSAMTSLATCWTEEFDVPDEFKPLMKFPDPSDTNATDALWAACLVGKVPEVSEGTIKRKLEGDMAATPDRNKKSQRILQSGANVSRVSTLKCLKRKVGSVIGKSGVTIKALQKQYQCNIVIDQDNEPVTITISGQPETLDAATCAVLEIIARNDPFDANVPPNFASGAS